MSSVTQDTVHLGVKFKARLMKPGIILPMGTYLASASDLKLIFTHCIIRNLAFLNFHDTDDSYNYGDSYPL